MATGKIYLAKQLINANVDNIDLIAAVLLEEFGHYLDSRLNACDSEGDEGDIFSRIVYGDEIGETELIALKLENDSATVVLDGVTILIEQDNVVGAYKNLLTGGWWVDNNENDNGVLIGDDIGNWIDAWGGNDKIDGGGGDDSIKGGDGDDTITGGAGVDWLDGQNGSDTADYSTSPQGVNVTLGTGWLSDSNFQALTFNDGWGGKDKLYNFENLTGSIYHDWLVGDLYAFPNIIKGGSGNDNIYGNGGNDALYGENGHDSIDGGDGDDLIWGGMGINTIFGGEGNDSIYLEDYRSTAPSYNKVFGGPGIDTVHLWYLDNDFYSKFASVNDAASFFGLISSELYGVEYLVLNGGRYFADRRLELSNFDDTGSSNADFITSDNNFGMSLSEVTVVSYQISDDGGRYLSFPSDINPRAFSDGTYNIRAAVFQNGNNSIPTYSFLRTVTIDTSAISGSLALGTDFADSGSSATDRITSDNTFSLALSGQEAGSTVVFQRSTKVAPLRVV